MLSFLVEGWRCGFCGYGYGVWVSVVIFFSEVGWMCLVWIGLDSVFGGFF